MCRKNGEWPIVSGISGLEPLLSYFGVWVNKSQLRLLSFVEGDLYLTLCADAAAYDAEISEHPMTDDGYTTCCNELPCFGGGKLRQKKSSGRQRSSTRSRTMVAWPAEIRHQSRLRYLAGLGHT